MSKLPTRWVTHLIPNLLMSEAKRATEEEVGKLKCFYEFLGGKSPLCKAQWFSLCRDAFLPPSAQEGPKSIFGGSESGADEGFLCEQPQVR